MWVRVIYWQTFKRTKILWECYYKDFQNVCSFKEKQVRERAGFQKESSRRFVGTLNCKGEWESEKLKKNQTANNSHLLLSGRDRAGMTTSQKELVKELRIQWKLLWQKRVDDKLRAESMATADYCDLFIEKGTVIHATRDIKALNFKDILAQHQVANAELYIPPVPKIGGWGKFIKTRIMITPSRRRRLVEPQIKENRAKQHSKQGDRGWLHKC